MLQPGPHWTDAAQRGRRCAAPLCVQVSPRAGLVESLSRVQLFAVL